MAKLFSRRWDPVAAAIVAGVALSFISFVAVRRVDDIGVAAALNTRVDWRAQDFAQKLKAATAVTGAFAVHLATLSQYDPANLERFARIEHASGDPASAIVWAPWVAQAKRASIAADIGTSDFKIIERAPAGNLIAAGERADYLPVLFELNYDGRPPQTGFDILSLPNRREWAERARDEGKPIATPASVLPMGSESPLGYVVYWPVYRTGTVPATFAERRANIAGMVLGRFRFDRLFPAAIANTPAIVETIDFYIDSGNDQAALQHVARYDPQSESFSIGATVAPAPESAVTLRREFDVLGRRWQLVSAFSPDIVAAGRSLWPWFALAIGLMLTALLAAYLERERNLRRTIEREVGERTSALRASERQLIHAQRMEAVGNLTGGMAHDFNNLLGVIVGDLDVLRDIIDKDSEVDRLAKDALDAALKGADLTRRLLAFARRQPLQPERVDANDLISNIIRLLSRVLGGAVDIKLQLAPDLWPIFVDPAQLESAITNLATNARDAMPQGGTLTISTRNGHLDSDYASRHAELAPGDYIVIEVTDTGIGIAPEVISHIYDPFFTTKEAGKGTGLGLSMVFGFLKQSGGHINVYSEPEAGTTFRLYLRRASETEMIAAEKKAPAEPLKHGGETVLVVEDNAALRQITVRQIRSLGYQVIEADNAAEALAALTASKVDLLFTDVVMPGGFDGFELARQAAAQWPGLKVLLTSGFPDTKLNANLEKLRARLLSKPFRIAELADSIRAVLDGNASSIG